MSDAEKVAAYAREVGLAILEPGAGWTHMGALLADACLQPGINYKAVVLPKVRALYAAWPEASTTTAFLRRLAVDDVGLVLGFRGRKLRVLSDLAVALREEDIETAQDLRLRLQDPSQVAHLRHRLLQVHGVGEKTVDYLGILAGVQERVAVDVHLRKFVEDAGITQQGYAQVAAVIRDAALLLHCPAAALDAAIWRYMSSRPRRG